MRTINRLLVANRGEIASRVFATWRRLGIETVAVASDADADLPYVAEADRVVRLPGNTPAETYLDATAVIDGALAQGADAIHPGYGFLSENAEFARAVEAAGMLWVGPSPESIEQMGSKIEAKQIMADAGVPVLTDDGSFPVLVKASAGGGGRGMRIVREAADLDAEVEKASAEAASAFGDGTVFVEPYVERGRHIEVQVVGDPALGITHVLFERDCSVQRRHQKVVEESPAPGLSDEQRQALYDAARAAGDAIGYRGAGTVEFLVDADDPSRFWFLEMNTRLQVEHPVTEAVTGLDLVAAQIAVAEGRPPDLDEASSVGHAIEVRLYAEDTEQSYAAQAGDLAIFEVDHETTFGPTPGHGVRLDAGFASGTSVSTFYDAMLAKVIAWAPSREQAVRLLAATLRRARIHGITTNRDQLLAILGDEEFGRGEMTTGLLDREVTPRARHDLAAAAMAATAASVQDTAQRRTVQARVPAGWRNVVSAPQSVSWDFGGPEPLDVSWLGTRSGGVQFPDADFDVRRVAPTDDGWRVDFRWEQEESWALVRLEGASAYVDGPLGSQTLRVVPRFVDPADAVASGSLLAPMPGTVVKVLVESGQHVEAGTPVLVLEAMKMQHSVAAPHAGTVTELPVSTGQQVAAGEVLAVVEEEQQ